MKARKKTPYQQHVEAMESSGLESFFGKTHDDEKRLAHIYSRRRGYIQQLVEHLQYIKNWQPANRPPAATPNKSSENRNNQQSDHIRDSKGEGSPTRLSYEKRMVTFFQLYEYSKKMIGEWKSDLLCILPSGLNALASIPMLTLAVTSFISKFPSVTICTGLLGTMMFLGALPHLIYGAVQLARSAPKAIPALAARSHLKRFFNTYPDQVKSCTASEIVLNHIHLPAEAIK